MSIPAYDVKATGDHQAAVQRLASTPNPGDVDVRSVEALVGQLLPTGTVALELIAKQFGIHPKALQRRLAREGATFEAVVDGVRRARAEHLLRNTELRLAQLAEELGYAEQSVLTRSCRRWFGCAPSVYRGRNG